MAVSILYLASIPPITENQLDKKTENEMETEV